MRLRAFQCIFFDNNHYFDVFFLVIIILTAIVLSINYICIVVPNEYTRYFFDLLKIDANNMIKSYVPAVGIPYGIIFRYWSVDSLAWISLTVSFIIHGEILKLMYFSVNVMWKTTMMSCKEHKTDLWLKYDYRHLVIPSDLC